MKEFDIILSVGHDLHPGNEGAQSPSLPECQFWRWWAHSMARAIRGAGLTCMVMDRWEEVTPYSARQAHLVERINKRNPKLCIDLHFNAYQGSTAGCCAVVHPNSTKGKQAGSVLTTAVSGAQGNKALPLQTRTESWAGSELVVLTQTNCPAVILEPFFGDVASDHDAALKALRSGATQKAVALALRDLILEWG